MSTTVKWGLITGMVYIIFSLISNMLDLQSKGGFSATGLAVNTVMFAATFFTIYMGIKENRDQNRNGYITFGEGLRNGLGISLIAAVIGSVFTVIYITVIDPNMMKEIMGTIEEQWEKQGMSEEQMDAARKWTGIMFKPWAMALMSIISVIFWGLIKSLIASAMLKKDAPPTVPVA